MIKRILIFICFLASFSSCVAVKEYQKIDLNDPDMSLSSKEVDANVNTALSYREGSTGATSGKTGGGCGCN